ncbi:MAG: hypothetical protein RLZZ450_4766 [Pseudomonadota bacterium]
MSETPLPQTLSAMHSADAPDETSSTGEFRARRRSTSAELRPVSAFAPGHGTGTHGHVGNGNVGNGNASHERGRTSEPPAAGVVPAHARAITEDDLRFVAALRSSGVAGELNDSELGQAIAALPARSGAFEAASRRLDILSAYYAAENDALAAQRRQATDRWFMFRANEGLNAPQLLARLLDVVPELQGTALERVGGSDGTLVLRAGDDVCAFDDEREEQTGTSTISVSDLVRAINVLLDRRSVRARLVGLIGDGKREAYLGLPSVTSAIVLSSGDYLAVADAEALLDLTGW